MTHFRFHLGAAAALLIGLSAFGAAQAEEPPPGACHNGAYRLSDGSDVIFSPADSPALRYRRPDGMTGRLLPTAEGRYAGAVGWSAAGDTVQAEFGPCGSEGLNFGSAGTPVLEGRRIAFPTLPMTFESDGLALYGELILPVSGRPEAVVVLQYGSDPESAVWNNYLQYLLPLDGIGVLVFDKRGTGRSEGSYSAHFGQLSDDMAAAVAAVRLRPEVGAAPVGLLGESQGGWVVPLTATKTLVDFVIAAYGLAVPITEEDRLEVIQNLQERGFDDPETIAKAEGFHRQAMRVVGSKFTEGLDELERQRTLYADEPWFDGLGGDITGMLAATPANKMDDIARIFSFPMDLTYAPEPVIARVDAPMLWVLAGRDTEAPHETTLAVLRDLQARGRPIDVAVFPNAGHGIIELEADGSRAGRQSAGYLELLSQWIRSRALAGPYGHARLYERTSSGADTRTATGTCQVDGCRSEAPFPD